MITLNRSDSRTVHEQLVEQIRFLVASGRFRVGDRMPSTRVLARRLSVSFHTVRKAYARLAEEGLLEAVRGSGYRVVERRTESRSDRLEQGADVMQATLRTLVGLGLSESEIAYVFEEQLDLILSAEDGPRVIYVAEFREAADTGAAALSDLLGHDVEGVVAQRIDTAPEADYAIASLPLVRRVMEHMPRADVIGVQVTLTPAAADAAARLFEHQTLLLVVRYPDSVGPLSRMIKAESGFSGQIIALAVEEGDTRLGGLARQCDLLLYTPGAHRALRTHLAAAGNHRAVDVVIPRSEIDRLRGDLPG